MERRAPLRSSAEPTKITIMQGQARASGDTSLEYTTILGSCVATCLFDPVAKVGGMNHFLLAEPPSNRDPEHFDEHYGLFLMELLVNETLALGAKKSRLKARLYGGANIRDGLAPIGSANAAFARSFLLRESIELTQEDLEGRHARRVHFLPSRGLVRCRTLNDEPLPMQQPLRRPKSAGGDVELF